MNIKTSTSLSFPEYLAWDDDSYDGAADSPTRHQIGIGITKEAAVADLLEKINDD